MDISDNKLNISPYSLDKKEKEQFLSNELLSLSEYHMQHCDLYHRMMKATVFDPKQVNTFYEIPFLPVRLFKEYDLLSVDRNEIIKTMTSSGTTGSAVSKIYLDRETSSNQTKVLTKILSSYIGTKRLPMIILDSETVIKDRNLFSARGAGILGFSMFGYDKIYALDENMKLKTEELKLFIDKHKEENILLFGFTFIIWQHFYSELVSTKEKYDLSKGIMIHGGGWKKLADSAISSDVFKTRLEDACGITKVYNYYGMVEQTGTIYMECEKGHLHCPVFSDVIIRDPNTFQVSGAGEEGLIEVVSILPKSYPGHALLTEDIGVLDGEDDCECGRLGKYFRILGRIKNAEIRGCSDTYASDSR